MGNNLPSEYVCGVRKIYHKTANLFDKDNVTWIYGNTAATEFTFLQNSAINHNSDYEPNRTFYISCKPLTTYTIVFDNSYTKRLADIATVPVVNDKVNNFIDNFTDSTKIYTTSATANYMIVQLYINGEFDAGARSADIISGLMIVEGSVAPSGYIPYGNTVYPCYKSLIKTSVLPSEYTELEYIQSSGTQWIDTGITLGSTYLNTNMKLELDADVASGSAWQVIGGSLGSAGLFIGVNGSNYIAYACGADIVSSIVNPCVRCKWINDAKNGKATVIRVDTADILLDATYTPTAKTAAVNLALFSFFKADNTISPYKMSGKIYSAKIYNNNTAIRNFISAKRNTDSILGMYDTVTNTFFTNQGTGVFTAGPEVGGTYILYKHLITA